MKKEIEIYSIGIEQLKHIKGGGGTQKIEWVWVEGSLTAMDDWETPVV